MKEYYKILDVSEFASNEEIDIQYKRLKEKYSRERFLEGEAGNEAAKNLTKLETAYSEIMASRKNVYEEDGNVKEDFSEIEKLIKLGNISGAQRLLDDYSSRSAEWHYLQSVIFYKKNWTNESKMQLEIALNMDPHNAKYADAYSKLKQKMEFNNRQFHSGNTAYGEAGGPAPRQMGGDAGNCLTFCATWCCIDMMCSLCCR